MKQVIQNQSIVYSIINYFGAFIGVFSTLYIYPSDLNLYGLYGFLTNTASLLTPFITLGFGSVLLRYFPYFENRSNGHGGFFFFILSGYGIGILCFSIIFFGTLPWLKSFFPEDTSDISNYFIYLLPLTILYVIFELFSTYCTNYKRIVIPTLLSNSMKILLPVLFVLALRHYIDTSQFIYAILGYYCCVIGVVIMYLYHERLLFMRPNIKIFTHPMRHQMVVFALYSILGGASAIIALRIDTLMISSIMGTAANGSFILAVFMSNVCYIPALAITEILNAPVATVSKEKDQAGLLSYYKKSTVNMLIPTLWLALILFISFDSLAMIMPNTSTIVTIKMSLGLLLIARIVDAGTGINSHILSFSKYYKLELYLLICLAILNVMLNWFLIPFYGITGAALGTCLSVIVFNIAKTFLIYITMNIHPFDSKIVRLLSIGLVLLIFNYCIPNLEYPYFNIAFKCILGSILFFSAVFYYRISPELELLLLSKWKQLGNRVG